MNDSEVRTFLRAAAIRLTSAQILFDAGQHSDSMYFAGYVVECAMKALLLARTPKRSRDQLKIFSGEKGHNLEHLSSLIRRHNQLPRPIPDYLRRLRSWKTTLRYETHRGDPNEAKSYLEAAEGVLKWVQKNV